MQIKKIIEQAVGEVHHPANEKMGDYASNLAMRTGEKAEQIKERLEKDEGLMKVVEKIEAAGPGFINFWLKKKWLVEELGRVIEQGEDYGRGDWGKGKRMLIDYSSPNIAKQFSVGHLRSTIIGQAIYNLYKFSGWDCVGDNHLGDWGTQFGMIIAAAEKWDLDLSKMKVEEIEEVYVKYNRLAKEDEKYLTRAQEAFSRLENDEEKAKKIWQTAVDISIKEFNKVYDLLGIKIDEAYGESFYKEMLAEVIKTAKEKRVAVVGEGGALIIEFDDLPPAMLLKSNGSSTYFTRDLATIKWRRQNPKLASDLYIYEVGAEQTLPFKQLFATAEKMGWGKKDDYVHVAHGLVLGEDGKKMSTRKGTTERMDELLKKMIERASEINKQSAKQVGIGAVIFNDLKHSPQTSYKFDWQRALSLEGDSGPYVQYACVRAKSVLFQSSPGPLIEDENLRLSADELAVLRQIYRFGEVIEEAAKGLAPNLVCEYLLELSRKFNGFYAGEKIVGNQIRLAITAGVAQVLENGLKLLQIEVPNKM